jgi:hypothetical protein
MENADRIEPFNTNEVQTLPFDQYLVAAGGIDYEVDFETSQRLVTKFHEIIGHVNCEARFQMKEGKAIVLFLMPYNSHTNIYV